MEWSRGAETFETISVCDAKTHLPSFLRRVERGEQFTITRHGIPVAVLSPLPNSGRPDVRAAMEQVATLRKSRKGRALSLDEIRELSAEGRR